ncbi:hypothetical protein BJ170DRAFT_66862 [Xylariales sp. AK1849]|nr:hypothetical protein BJ170DRAFT_66862 [Xylariales sp. AK1849]
MDKGKSDHFDVMPSKALEPNQPPPPYQEVEPAQTSWSKQSLSSHTTSRAFPLRFNLYSKHPAKELFLGEHQEQPLYAITRSDETSSKPRNVVLHNGVSTSNPALGTGQYVGSDDKRWEIKFSPGDSQSITVTEIVSQEGDWMERVFRFSVETDTTNGRENFEWRRAPVSSILGGQTLGWKLIRITKDLTETVPKSSGGTRKESTGNEEVVAACSKNTTLWTKYWRFAFLGTGAAGVLGTRWKLMTVMTSLMLLDYQIDNSFG